MEQVGYKHFSHTHNLIIHQMPEGVEVSCTGCKSSCTGTVYVCWHCNFFLHEQCYRATRSLKHPLHPPHPLTLVPYPTYSSNSFYCNSCEIMGTGISYSCADCEFDLHVHCAYSLSTATTFQKTHQYQELVPPTWNVQNSSIGQNVPIVSVPSCVPNPFRGDQNLFMPPSYLSDQYHSSSHDLAFPPIPIVHDPCMTQNRPPVSIPINPPNQFTNSQYPSMPQNGLKNTGIMHFSHPHNLSVVNLQNDVEDKVTCSACVEPLVGKGYSCVEPKCGFHLHESCFHLKKEIQHNSHPEHPLNLLQLSPYNNKTCEFNCNACSSNGTGFTYHCSICTFDLHIQCVNLPETKKRSDHEHLLKLFYSCPEKYQEYAISCDVCHGDVQKDRWMYYCESCDYGTHLGCVDCKECKVDSVIDPQVQLQRMQLQMEMARQQAQLIASMGASLASLA